MGRKSKGAQLQAVKTKRLHTLHELNYIFLKGSISAVIVPFLKYAKKMKISPCYTELYKYVSASPNMKYQARFRFLLAVNFPCFIKRVGIRLNNKLIADGASALFMSLAFATNHNYYRDFYHLRYMNGKFVECQEEVSPEDPDISRFLGVETVDTRPNLVKFPKKIPGENIRFASYKDKYSYMTESVVKNDNHQGGDFIQEDALGRVSKFLKRGKIFDVEIFADAASKCQNYQTTEREKGKGCAKSKTRRPKYQNEIQSLAAAILARQEIPDQDESLGIFHDDVLDLAEVGWVNYKQYFMKKIKGIPTTQIKLRPAFITKSSCDEFNKIENKTKEEILGEIKKTLSKVVFDEVMERQYYEAKVQRSYVKKSELIDVYHELKTRMILNNLTEYTGGSEDCSESL